MELTREYVLKNQTEFLTVQEFCSKYGGNITPQAVYYAMDKDLVDWMSPARERFVVMTEKSKNYVPNSSPTRVGGKRTIMNV